MVMLVVILIFDLLMCNNFEYGFKFFVIIKEIFSIFKIKLYLYGNFKVMCKILKYDCIMIF